MIKEISEVHVRALNELASHVYDVAASKGFHSGQPRPATWEVAAIVCDRIGTSSRAWEDHRKGKDSEMVLESDKPEKFSLIDNDAKYFASFIMNLHGEVSELYEAFVENRLHEPCDKASKMEEMGLSPLNCAAEELADIIIRALDTAETLGIDIGEAIRVKSKYNESRPFRHGGKKA